LYKKASDLDLLKAKKKIIKKRLLRATSKFNIGDTVWVLDLIDVESQKCPKCKGKGKYFYKGYEHFCENCHAEGKVPLAVKKFKKWTGKITEIRMRQFRNEPNIDYSIFTGDCTHIGVAEGDVFSSIKDLQKKAKELGYEEEKSL